jgi:peptidoglycan hydrolase CwlO-like protein
VSEPSKAERGSEVVRTQRNYTDLLDLNQQLVKNVESLLKEHEDRKKELEELRFSHDQAQGEIKRLREELEHAQARDAQRHEQLRALEQERLDQLGVMSAHLDALRSAVERYLHEGRSKAA